MQTCGDMDQGVLIRQSKTATCIMEVGSDVFVRGIVRVCMIEVVAYETYVSLPACPSLRQYSTFVLPSHSAPKGLNTM
jgi:hypothetical protein